MTLLASWLFNQYRDRNAGSYSGLMTFTRGIASALANQAELTRRRAGVEVAR